MAEFTVSPADATKYKTLFHELCAKAGGVSTLDKTSAGLAASGLPVDALMKIWTLSDLDGDDCLNLNEYMTCCALIAGCVRGNFNPPETLPADFFSNVSTADTEEEDDDGRKKRTRLPPFASPASSAPAAHAVWAPPSASQLYAAGLENKAEAVSTSASWSIDGNAWRAANFSGADTKQATLKQRQADARRMLLRKS